MKQTFTLLFGFLPMLLFGQYADFTGTGTSGTGTFNSPIHPGFTYLCTGTMDTAKIDFSETFDAINNFEATFGEADDEENINIRLEANGENTEGTPITSTATITINFDYNMPDNGWGFIIKDIDVDQVVISAIDDEGNPVTIGMIDSWFSEAFDAVSGEANVPKWDGPGCALLGANTPSSYNVYDNLVIGGLSDTESGTGTFLPNVSLQSLSIRFENLQSTHTPSFHFYMAVSQAVLPVELSEFEATYDNTKHMTALQWKTETEINCDKFVVQSSNDGKEFRDLQEVWCAGDSDRPQSYEAEDKLDQNEHGHIYYRLKQVDIDGQYHFSPIVSIFAEERKTMEIFPTVISRGNSFTINDQSGVEFKMYDAFGLLVTKQDKIENKTTQVIQTSKFNAGMYWITTGKSTVKLLIL